MKVGDYVRTDKGEIGRVTSIANDNNLGLGEEYNGFVALNTEPYVYGTIIKSKEKPIDLIEEGDYINGLRVEKNKYGELYTSYVYYGGDIGKQSEVYTTWLEEYKEDEDYIKLIVTKEQFERMAYMVWKK